MSYRQGGVYQRHSNVGSLSVLESLKLQATFLQQGLTASLKVSSVLETLSSNKSISGRIMKSSLLQSIVLCSSLILEPIMLRGHRIDSTISVLFHAFWLYPLSLASIYYAGLLNNNSNDDGRRSRNNISNSLKGDYAGLASTVIAESYRVLLLANYFAVVYVLNLIPYLGPILSFIYACVIDSYYCFESVLIKQNLNFSERVNYVQSRWGYFIGFGVPITALSCWSADPVVNLAIFSLLYPFFNLMGASSSPTPLDPNLPTSSQSLSFLPQAQDSFAAEGGEEGRNGNAFVPKSLPVLFFADKIFSLISQQGGSSSNSKKKDAGGNSSSSRNNYGGGADSAYRGVGDNRRNQAPPQSSPYQYHGNQSQPQPQSQPIRYASNSDRTMDNLINSAARRSKRD